MHFAHLRNKKISESGFSLVEVVVASAIISLTLLSVISIAGQSISISHRSLDTYNASALLEEGAEAVRTVRDNGWSNISGLTAGTVYYPTFSTTTNSWSLSTTANTVGIFTRTVTFAAVNRNSTDDISATGTADSGTKLVTVSVSWQEGATTLTKTLQFYTFNIFS